MKPSQETCDKIDKLIPYLREEPKRFAMGYWGLAVDPALDLADLDPTESSDEDSMKVLIEQNPPCKTIHCLAGGVLISAGLVKPTFDGQNVLFELGYDTPTQAATYLGLPQFEADKLFYMKAWNRGNGWPKEFEDMLNRTKPGSPEAIEVVITRLEYFKETGE